jgi:hypothetical protein
MARAKKAYSRQFEKMVRAVGIEPTLLAEPDFESPLKSSKILFYNTNIPE